MTPEGAAGAEVPAGAQVGQSTGTKFVGIEGTSQMTKIVSKGSGRPAATAKSNRHAQRTPLPPKAGVVEGAQELVAYAQELQAALAEDLGKASLTRLRQILALMDLPAAGKSATRADIIALIEKGRKPQSEAASVAAPATAGKSLGKAEAFAEKARAAKWQVSIEAQDGDAAELTATRDGETIVQAWSGGVWQYPSSFYGYGDRNTRPRNASGALKLLARSPEDARADAGKVAANKHFRKAEPKDITVKLEEAQRRLPFDPALAPDEMILAAVNGQALVWYNSLSRGQESALVSRRGARISVTTDGKRVLTFCCPVTGYRSCYVSSLLRVGKGRSSVTKGTATDNARVEVA